MVAVFLSPVYLLVNAYLVYRMLIWFAALHGILGSLWFAIPFLFIYLLLCLTPLAAAILPRGPVRYGCRRISNSWLGVLMYLLICLFLSDLIWCIWRLMNGLTPFQLPDPAVMRLEGTGIAAVVLALAVYGIVHAMHLKRTSYEVQIEKSSSVPGIRIALAADLHLGSSADYRLVRRMVDEINAMQPDLIVFAGDIFDNDFEAISHPEKVLDALRGMKSRYGAYACWGNHDIDEMILAGFTFASGDGNICSDPRMNQFLADAGIRLLKDETLQIGHAFTLTGRLDRSCEQKSGKIRLTPGQLASGIDRTLPAIVIDHQPAEFDELAQAGFDLDLSGHTHDGQMFPSTIFTRLGWKNACGLQQIGSMTSIVTSGAGVWGPAMRIGSDSEVVEIEVKFAAFCLDENSRV